MKETGTVVMDKVKVGSKIQQMPEISQKSNTIFLKKLQCYYWLFLTTKQHFW